jgi:hypothetical protein
MITANSHRNTNRLAASLLTFPNSGLWKAYTRATLMSLAIVGAAAARCCHDRRVLPPTGSMISR